MGLEQRPGQTEHRELSFSTRGEVFSTPVVSVAQEMFRFHKKEFEGEQPAEDLRHIGEEESLIDKERSTMSPDGFEPFEDPSIGENLLFVNGYNGNYAKEMRLSRRAVERVLEIAHLGGQVFLSARGSLPKSSIDNINPDNSVTAKKSLFAGQTIEQREEKVPDYRVVNVGENGWQIEVNDKGITDELKKKDLSGSELKKAFIERFNGIVRDGLFESIRREKLSSEKYRDFDIDLFLSVIDVLWGSLMNFSLLSISIPIFLSGSVFTTLIFFGFHNLGSRSSGRKIDSRWEWFMPPVEIDKVARAYAFLKGKGRNLVKEKGID